jgi:hypothetical protein
MLVTIAAMSFLRGLRSCIQPKNVRAPRIIKEFNFKLHLNLKNCF